ncbi:MAG: hypothetical protein JWO30_1959 [Fibrobacteres bacterium]|nr:hypothetical protein [Fibrobacterota bacterium]
MRRLPSIRGLALGGLLCGGIAAAHAAGTAPEVLGGHEGWLDRMGGGIRELGMGNTGTASEEAMPAAFWNPAILPFNRQVTVGVGADIRTLSRNGGFAGVQGRVAANMGLGVGILNRGDFNVPAYDADEKSLGTAQPQAIGSYLGMGVKISRSNSFGAAVQWYSYNLDLGGGTGNVNVIGVFNLGWYKRWSNSLKTGVVVRNLGINKDLSADFDQTTLSSEDAQGFERTASDFMPKTLVAAVFYTVKAWNKTFDLSAEGIDYQLKRDLFVTDANFHAQAVRLGADWHLNDQMNVRAGVDQGNISAGLGYSLPWGAHKLLFDYAIVAERGLLTINPFAVGFRFTL